MRQVRDNTGHFALRPHYQPAELDRGCEKVLAEFFRPTHGAIPTPIPTDELARLIERDVSDFDPGADLSGYGTDVEGVTEFPQRRKPRVRIAAELAYDDRRENRYRTTLTHEMATCTSTVISLRSSPVQGTSFSRQPVAASRYASARAFSTLVAPIGWSGRLAMHVAGLLMPISLLRAVVATFQEERGVFGPIAVGTPQADAVIQLIRTKFHVSADAARIRLLKLDILAARDRGPSLFASG